MARYAVNADDGELAAGYEEDRAGAWIRLAIVLLCLGFWAVVVGAVASLV